MESNNYEWFITQTVESMLPCFSYRHISLCMKVQMDWTDHGYDEAGNTKVREERTFHKKVLLMFNRPSNYTKVLFKDISNDERSFLTGWKAFEMKQLSDHDSCWRHDGMNWVFQTFVEAWDFFKQYDIEGRKIDPMFHWDIFNGAPAYYRTDIKIKDKNPDQRWNSPYIVGIGNKIPMHEISKFMPDPNNSRKMLDLEEFEKLSDNFPLL